MIAKKRFGREHGKDQNRQTESRYIMLIEISFRTFRPSKTKNMANALRGGSSA